jgi:hypothetical protein
VNDRAVRRQESVPRINGFAALTGRKSAFIGVARSLLLALTLLGVEELGLLRGHGCGGGVVAVVGMKIGGMCRIARSFFRTRTIGWLATECNHSIPRYRSWST